MLSAELREAWAGKSARTEPVTVREWVRSPNPLQPGHLYVFKDCSWDEIGAPVRNRPRAHRGGSTSTANPIPFPSPGALLQVEMSRSRAADGRNPGWSSSATRQGRGSLRGTRSETEHHVRLCGRTNQAVLADPESKMMLFAWTACFIAVAAVVLQVLTSSLAPSPSRAWEWSWRDRVFLRLSRHLDDPRSGDLMPQII